MAYRTKATTVVISSTKDDLNEYRAAVKEVCLNLGLVPKMMENMPASEEDAIKESLRLVDGADIYIGIIAHRYGYVPKGHEISITHMEYNRAGERGITRRIFLMHKDQQVYPRYFEMGDGATKLQLFKNQLKKEHVVNFFKSPDDLARQVMASLVTIVTPNSRHYPLEEDTPIPPRSYIAYPYTLLQTEKLVGRKAELDLLDKWVSDPNEDVYEARIFVLTAMGGSGKSALAWHWFRMNAPSRERSFAGKMWWSFYEGEPHFNEFITHALSYVNEVRLEEVKKLTQPEREKTLLTILDHKPFLIVLNGLERILNGYSERNKDPITAAADTIDSEAQNDSKPKPWRETADPRAGLFLRKLISVQASRILISTRDFPADLENAFDRPLSGVCELKLNGLNDQDAFNLWQEFSVSGSSDELKDMFHTFENLPLLIQLLAKQVRNYSRAPGNYEKWRDANRDFNPFNMELMQVKSHVLEFALRDLDKPSLILLETIAAFRKSPFFITLSALLIGEGKPFQNHESFLKALDELVDRGLVGWTRGSNRCDLHPVVRGVIWSRLNEEYRHSIYETLLAYIESSSAIETERESVPEDLTIATERYNTLIRLKRYDEAYAAFREHLENPKTLFTGSQFRAELLELLFPNGIDNRPALKNPADQAYTLKTLAQAYRFCGQPKKATLLYELHNRIEQEEGKEFNYCKGLLHLAETFFVSGELRLAEAATRLAVKQAQQIMCDKNSTVLEAYGLNCIGIVLAARGLMEDSRKALRRAARIIAANGKAADPGSDLICLNQIYRAQKELWSGRLDQAYETAKAALVESSRVKGANERYEVIALRLIGETALRLKHYDEAKYHLKFARAHALEMNQVEDEIPTLINLAELHRIQSDLDKAREFLALVWKYAERSYYPLFMVDAHNVLAQVECDNDDLDSAIEEANKAYELAWGIGKPYHYAYGLGTAEALLKKLNAPLPLRLPAFDESQYERMVGINIDSSRLSEVINTLRLRWQQLIRAGVFATVSLYTGRT